MKEEILVRQFENKGEYVKIWKTIEEKAYTILSDRKKLLELAALSTMESIMENPRKYSSLIRYNMSSGIDYAVSNFNSYFMYGQPPQIQQQVQSEAYFTEDYIAMLSEDANKFLERLAKVVEDEVINDYAMSSRFHY